MKMAVFNDNHLKRLKSLGEVEVFPITKTEEEAIKEAKRQGKKLYNFWGVVPPERPNHPWQGLTLFKTGFGGRRVNFLHAKDLPLSYNYWKTYAIETAWRMYRGY